jgi:hypothetical protein
MRLHQDGSDVFRPEGMRALAALRRTQHGSPHAGDPDAISQGVASRTASRTPSRTPCLAAPEVVDGVLGSE